MAFLEALAVGALLGVAVVFLHRHLMAARARSRAQKVGAAQSCRDGEARPRGAAL